MKKLLFNRYSYLIFALCMLPTMFVDASSHNSPEDKYTLDVFSDEIVYIDLSRIKTRPDIRPSGPRRSRSNFNISIEAWLRNSSLFLYSECDMVDVEIVIYDEYGNEVLCSNMDVMEFADNEVDVSSLFDGKYTLYVTINGRMYYGCFDIKTL